MLLHVKRVVPEMVECLAGFIAPIHQILSTSIVVYPAKTFVLLGNADLAFPSISASVMVTLADSDGYTNIAIACRCPAAVWSRGWTSELTGWSL